MSPLLLPAKWPAPPNIRAGVSLRSGGVSGGRYASLNLGDHVGDRPAAVAENRRRLAGACGLTDGPNWLEQVHGTTVVDLDGAWSGPADGAATARKGVACAVMTADCLPVLFCDRAGQRVGAAHAGWRGLAQGVLGNAVAAMGNRPDELLAWFGPAIGPAAYEVGGEVREAFLARDTQAAGAFEANARGRWQADLYALARLELKRLGVHAIHGGNFCTHTDAKRFYSHRREAPCGRMASLIWIAD
jgi:YfiH family protein